MKKLSYLLLGAAALTLASCSQQDLGNPATGDTATVAFKVNMPGDVTTRALGDGTAATALKVVVLEIPAEGSSVTTPKTVLIGDATVGTDGQADVTLDLVTGKNYQIGFFASSSTAFSSTSPVYSVSNTGVLTVNYGNMTSEGNMADAYDCFYGNYTTGKLTTSISDDVTLTRPVAQINWGTTPIAEGSSSNFNEIFGDDGKYMMASLITGTDNAYNQLNLLTGEYSNTSDATTTAITFPAMAAPSGEGITFPSISTDQQTSYDYVAMQYILAPATSSIINLTLTINNSDNGGAGDFTNDIIVTNAPIQANYKTNIYGSLLSGNVSFNVIKGDWGDPDNEVDMTTWDGSSVTYPSIPEDNTTPVMINRPSDLAGLAEMVKGTAEGQTTPNTFAGFTIALAADFDMGGNEFEGIGAASRNSDAATGTSFQGVFDGKGHTISNVKIIGTDNPNDAPGFIGNLDGSSAALQNVTFANLEISAPNNEQAGVVGIVTNGATVSGVTVSSGSVSSAEAAGGIVGRVLKSGTVTECENYASISSTVKNAGGIIGAAYYTEEGTTMTVSNCKNHGDVNGTNQAVAGIVGLSAAVVSGCYNDGNITGTGSSAVGGIVGQQNYAGSVTGCTNTGTVVGGTNPTNYGAGGIVGWVRYSGSSATAYARQNVITVNSNNNSGSVSGQTGVGGIVGMWYTCGQCNYNSNTAPTLTAAGTFVAGIIGGQQWTETPPTLAPDTENITTLFVEYNYSNTLQSNMSGGNKADIIYVNSPEQVVQTGNSTDDPDVVNQGSND